MGEIMKSIFIILGNGFTIDFLTHYNKYNVNNPTKQHSIDVTNLMMNGEKIITPWDKKPGFLSYKNCPALWTLGARPYQSSSESISLIEEIISCANMFFDFIHDKEQQKQRIAMRSEIDGKIYLKAYCELVTYIQQLFSYYNSKIDDGDLDDFLNNYNGWGWKEFLNRKRLDKYEEIVFVTYKYDIWLERMLKQQKLPFSIVGFKGKEERIKIIKPHGSISFVPQHYEAPMQMKYNLDIEGGQKLESLEVKYDDLLSYMDGAIIPPTGDSTRLETSTSWAKSLRKEAIAAAKNISKSDANDVVLCGISYWYVDRHEIDELLINLNHKANLIFINPHPPRDLNAVLSSIFQNYVLQTSSDNIGGLLNG